jgi:hypothetical protein
MILDKRTLLLVDSDGVALLHKISAERLIPLNENKHRDVRPILRKLAKEGTVTHLMPNVVHDVQLLAAAPHFMSTHKKVH